MSALSNRTGNVMPEPYYSDDLVTLYHGDCREILPSLPQPCASTVLTDPPFFMPAQQYAGRDTTWQQSWADTSILAGWWDAIAKLIQRCVDPAGHVMVFCDDASYPVFYPAMYTRWPNLACLVWNKGRPGMGSAWRNSTELIISARGRAAYWTGSATGNIICQTPVHSSERVHPVDKPVGLLIQLLRPTTPAGALVLDPFAGGGSTLLGARALGMRAIGVELDESYCEVIASRLAQDVLPFGEIA